MADDMWEKNVKKKREKRDKIWLKVAENTISEIVKKPAVDFNSTNNEEFAKKNEKTIFGSRHPTLYFGIVIIKNINRVAFIVMQDIGTTDYEQISTDVRYGAAESRTGENMLVGIQVVLVYDGIKTFRKISQEIKSKVCDNSARNFTKKKEKTIFGSRHPTLYFGIVIIKNINRVAFIVMQDIGTTDHELNREIWSCRFKDS